LLEHLEHLEHLRETKDLNAWIDVPQADILPYLDQRTAEAVPAPDFTGCGKTEFFEGDGLQAVRK
jgi:hypothetical protein